MKYQGSISERIVGRKNAQLTVFVEPENPLRIATYSGAAEWVGRATGIVFPLQREWVQVAFPQPVQGYVYGYVLADEVKWATTGNAPTANEQLALSLARDVETHHLLMVIYNRISVGQNRGINSNDLLDRAATVANQLNNRQTTIQNRMKTQQQTGFKAAFSSLASKFTGSKVNGLGAFFIPLIPVTIKAVGWTLAALLAYFTASEILNYFKGSKANLDTSNSIWRDVQSRIPAEVFDQLVSNTEKQIDKAYRAGQNDPSLLGQTKLLMNVGLVGAGLFIGYKVFKDN